MLLLTTAFVEIQVVHDGDDGKLIEEAIADALVFEIGAFMKF